MSDLEPYTPRPREEPAPRFVRWRFALAAILTVALMVGVVALISWLPPII
jgi:hypothetical protein